MVANPTFYKKLVIQSGTWVGHLNTTSALEGFQKAGVLAQKWEGGGGFVEGWRFELGPLKTGFTKMSSRILHTYPCSVLAKDIFCDELHR